MRLMSFSMTTAQVYAREKDVTRRDGWFKLQPGTLLCGVEKGMGLKLGEKVVRICVIRVKSNTPERLDRLLDPAYGPEEMRREGFPGLDPAEFVRRFNARGIPNHGLVSRIEFEYQDGWCLDCMELITTGFMAAVCPRGEQCALWPDDEDGAAFMREMKGAP